MIAARLIDLLEIEIDGHFVKLEFKLHITSIATATKSKKSVAIVPQKQVGDNSKRSEAGGGASKLNPKAGIFEGALGSVVHIEDKIQGSKSEEDTLAR